MVNPCHSIWVENLEIRELKDEISNLKTAFKNMVDLMLDEVDEMKTEIIAQSATSSKNNEMLKNEFMEKYEMLTMKQNAKESQCEDMLQQAEFMNDKLGRQFADFEAHANTTIDSIRHSYADVNKNFYDTLMVLFLIKGW